MRKIDSFQVGLEGKGLSGGEELKMQQKKGCDWLDATDNTVFAVFSF